MVDDEKKCIVVLSISSRRLDATIAWMRDDLGEQIVAQRGRHCRWAAMSPSERLEGIAEVLGMAAQSAGVRPLSVFVAMSDESLDANWASGSVDLGHPMTLTHEDRDLALVRAGTQAIGTNRKDLHALQPQWQISDENGRHDCDDPVGLRGSGVTCNVMLVTADRENYDMVDRMLASLDLRLEGMIAPPIGLYRMMSGSLPQRGSTILIDCGARHTSIIVHRKGRLTHLETNAFGSDDLTEEIAASRKISHERAEELKKGVDLSIHGSGAQQEDFGQQYLWQDVQENSRHLGPAAAVCSSLLRQFFRERFNYLKDSELLSHTGRVHLFGRAAALGGLPNLIKDIFGMETILGTKQATRDPAAEIAGAITVGLVRAAAEERQRQIARRQASSGFHQVASAAGGLLGWLTTPLQ